MNRDEAIDLCTEMRARVDFGVQVIPDARRPKKTRQGVQVFFPELGVSGAAETFEKACELAREVAAKKLARFAEKVGV